jgi:Uma2 family endonuclease
VTAPAPTTNPTSPPSPVATPPAGRCLRLSAVSWRTYTQLLGAFAERPGMRLTYDRGELEIMSPLLEHDDDGDFLGDLVFLLTLELGLPLKRGGSTTLRRRRVKRGLESDRCFWIANAPRMAGRRRLDLRTDPPPDLAIEVDVTRSSLDRMSIYAKLGVPEVWRLDGDKLTFHVLGEDGKYTEVAVSRSFPLVTPADLLGFLQQARQAGDENPVVQQFLAWVRHRRSASPADPAPNP